MRSEEKIAALGMGGSSGVSLEELVSLADAVLLNAGLKRPAIIATLATKKDDPVWGRLSQHYECDLLFFDAMRLEEETPKLKQPSDLVFASVGCHGVAESAALAAAGPHAKLLIEKTTSDCATAAIAVAQGV